MASPDTLLDLSTLIADRPTIRIDGATYHLRAPDELTLAESFKFSKWGKELEALARDPDKADALTSLLRAVASAAVADVPPEVFGRLSTAQHMAIVEVFTVLLLGRQVRLAGAIVSTGRQTGPNLSHVFSSPMAETPAGGFTPRRPPFSEPM